MTISVTTFHSQEICAFQAPHPRQHVRDPDAIYYCSDEQHQYYRREWQKQNSKKWKDVFANIKFNPSEIESAVERYGRP